MNGTTPATRPTAHEGLAVNHIAQPASSRALLYTRMGFSPRANVALSFLRFVEWLRAKLDAMLSPKIPVAASSLASPDYGRRQTS
jgi:hypothetical protein